MRDGNALEFPTQEGFGQSYSDVKSVYVKRKAIGLTYVVSSEGNQEIRGRHYRIDITQHRIVDELGHLKSEVAH
jgi:predicted RNA-binding protein